jgi:hypothetical protein
VGDALLLVLNAAPALFGRRVHVHEPFRAGNPGKRGIANDGGAFESAHANPCWLTFITTELLDVQVPVEPSTLVLSKGCWLPSL